MRDNPMSAPFARLTPAQLELLRRVVDNSQGKGAQVTAVTYYKPANKLVEFGYVTRGIRNDHALFATPAGVQRVADEDRKAQESAQSYLDRLRAVRRR